VIEVGRDLERMRDYLAGRLSDLENRAFEDRLARDPDLVRELELATRLREGLARLRDRGELDVGASRRVARRWTWGAALAATLAGVALLVFLQPAGRAPSVLAAAVAPATGTAATFTFVAMRGAVTAPVLDLPARGVVELRASPSSTSPETRYRIELERLGAGGSRAAVGELGGVAVGGDGLVHAYADASRLVAGNYRLTVRAEADPAAGVGTFSFSLRTPPR
jgi:hypothetical protein